MVEALVVFELVPGVVEALAVVDILGVVDNAAEVVDILVVVDGAAGVVDGAFEVVDGAAGVVDSCRFFFFFDCALIQGAVTVTLVTAEVPVCVMVEVTSLMGTKDEQKAEALRAIKIALQALTSSRASRCARGTCANPAQVEDEKRAATVTKVGRKCMVEVANI